MRGKFDCSCTPGAVFLPVVLAERLQAFQCGQCETTLLSLDAYRLWRRNNPDSPAWSVNRLTAAGVVSQQSAERSDGERVRTCPACSRLMMRYRVGSMPDFRLDRCGTCQLVWLDKGEWSRLVDEGLAGDLDEILTDEWQLRLQTRENRLRRDAQLRLRLGDETFEELQRIRAWLAVQPNRVELLGLLASSE